MSMLAIFVDGGYLDNIAKDEYHVRVDIGKLGKEICRIISTKLNDNVNILHLYYYDCLPWQGYPPKQEEAERYSNKRKFFYTIGLIPRVKVREGRLRYCGDDKITGEPIFQQKKIDLQLGLDFALLSGKRSIAHAVVITGDEDLLPAFKVASDEGILVWLFHGPNKSSKDGKSTYSQKLWNEAAERYEMNAAFFEAVKRT